MNFTYLNIYIIIPLAIFIFLSLEGVLGKSLQRFISNLFKPKFILIYILIYIFILYFPFINTVYALDEETTKKLGEVSVNNNVNISNPNINLPDSVFKGLTNVGIAGAIGGGMSATAKVIKSSGLSPTAKVGLVAGGGLLAGALVTVTNTANSIVERKINYSVTSKVDTNNITEPKTGNGGSAAFSIEPSADVDTVMNLLNANYYIHICILVFIWSILILCISNKVVNNKWNLEFIKNIFGESIHNILIKSLTYTSKSNNIFIIIGLILLIISSIYSLYISNFFIENIDIIADIIKESKK